MNRNRVLYILLLAYSDDTRISVIDLEGNVVADTAKDSISENHLNREEIQEALKSSEGYAQRKSETTGEDTLYVALYNHFNGYLCD